MSLTIGAAALSLAGSASALTAFTAGAPASGDPGIGAGQTVVANFDAGSVLGQPGGGVTETDTGPVGFYTGSSGAAAAPFGDTTQYEAISGTGSATFSFTDPAAIQSLSVYLGSVDLYNTITINESDNKSITFVGLRFPGHDGDQGGNSTNLRVFFNFAPTDDFQSITFASTQVAFEYDTIAVGASAVSPPIGDIDTPLAAPEPAAWAMMLIGFGGLGAVMRRRRVARAA